MNLYCWLFRQIRIRYSEGPLFQKSTIPTSPKPNPKAKPNPNSNPNFNPNLSTVAGICTMDFRNSGPVPFRHNYVCTMIKRWTVHCTES